MQWIAEHLEGLVALSFAIAALVTWLVRLQMRLNTIIENFTACQKHRDKTYAKYEITHKEITAALKDIGTQLNDTLLVISERLTRVETKLDDMNGGGR